jgi:hypothetical protein
VLHRNLFFACRLRIDDDDDVDVDEHHMNLQVFWEVLHRLLEELLLCPFFSVILLHLPDLDQPTTVVGRDYSAAAVLLQEGGFLTNLRHSAAVRTDCVEGAL